MDKIHWINIPLSDKEFKKLREIKGTMTWRTFILSLLKGGTK